MDVLENKEAWAANFHQGWLLHLFETGKIDWKKIPTPKE
jgi:hypothetical protein